MALRHAEEAGGGDDGSVANDKYLTRLDTWKCFIYDFVAYSMNLRVYNFMAFVWLKTQLEIWILSWFLILPFI